MHPARASSLTLSVLTVVLAAQPAPLHLDVRERDRIDAALAAGASWLRARTDANGAVVPTQPKVCPVAATGLALWALAEARHTEVDALQPLAHFLREHAQSDGGVYDPGHGLAVYTSGVAAAALRAHLARTGQLVDDLVRTAELFAQRGGVPESAVDGEAAARLPGGNVGELARSLLARGEALDDGERRAAEFLAGLVPGTPPVAARTRQPGPRPDQADALGAFSYDDLLVFVYQTVRPEQQIHLRAMAAIRRDFVLEHNPDLTKRYGPDGFRAGTQGLYYYYLVLARALAATGSPHVDLANGTRADWVRRLVEHLLAKQQDDGTWVNGNARWWEDDPVIVTSYALLALRVCHDMPASRLAAPSRH